MPTRVDLIYDDARTALTLAAVLYSWNKTTSKFWLMLFVYFLIKQIWNHREYYKLHQRLF